MAETTIRAEEHALAAPADARTQGAKRFEVTAGLTLAVFAAVLAVCELGANRFGEDEIKAINEKSAAFSWYQSKSIKESLAESQREALKDQLEFGSPAAAQQAVLHARVKKLDADIGRYKKEKKEILLGSQAVGKANWAQDVDGQMGKVTGAKEWEQIAARLNTAGDRFDVAKLFLQLCMVMGAISLVVQLPRMKALFYAATCSFGITGAVYTVIAYRAAGAF